MARHRSRQETSPRHDNSRSQADWFAHLDEQVIAQAKRRSAHSFGDRSDCRCSGARIAESLWRIVMFHSFTHETTDDAFVDVHTVSVAPKVAARGSGACGRQSIGQKGDVLVEIDPRDFQVALAQAKANLARDKATQIQAELNEKRALDLLAGRSSARRSEIPTWQLQSRAEQASKQMKQLSSRLNSTWATVKSKRR